MGLSLDLIEGVIDNYVIFGKVPPSNMYRVLIILCNYELDDLICSIRRCVCPFCGKVFRSRNRLKTHLSKSRMCRVQYDMVKKYVINMYVKRPDPICREVSKAYNRELLKELARVWGISYHTAYRLKIMCGKMGYV